VSVGGIISDFGVSTGSERTGVDDMTSDLATTVETSLAVVGVATLGVSLFISD
jgi:hypothetical protein